MEVEAALLVASENFVLLERRDRFVHEARKKPEKLMARVCHEIEMLFESRFLGGSCSFPEGDGCILYTLTGRVSKSTWGEAMKAVALGGGGFLIIDESGKRFFAQSEGFPPPKHYAADVCERMTPNNSVERTREK